MERSPSSSETLTEREAALYQRTRRETLADVRAEFALYGSRRPRRWHLIRWWRDRGTRAHAAWSTRVIDRVLERFDRITPLELLEDPPPRATPECWFDPSHVGHWTRDCPDHHRAAT